MADREIQCFDVVFARNLVARRVRYIIGLSRLASMLDEDAYPKEDRGGSMNLPTSVAEKVKDELKEIERGILARD